MSQVILFKIATRSNPDGLINILSEILQKVSDKENYKILVSADVDDVNTYNTHVINSIKHIIESKKVILCFDISKSKFDAINRDIELINDWDILVTILSDKVKNIEYNFDDDIRKIFSEKSPNNDDIIYEEDFHLLGKESYDKRKFIIQPSKDNCNLVINYYCDKNSERSVELNHCLLENLKNDKINKIVIISTESDYLYLSNILSKNDNFKNKVIPIITDKRPTFNDYFAITRKIFNGYDNINIISNLDIIIPSETIDKLPSYFADLKKNCLALSRWDIESDNSSKLFDRPDSQDTWIFMGSVPYISGADFTLGKAGCDNAIAHLIEQNGYNLINPSKTLKTYHLHLTNIRNYTDISGQAIERIPPPYKLIHPTE